MKTVNIILKLLKNVFREPEPFIDLLSWGKTNCKKKLCDGITFYNTSECNGFKISKNLNKLIPEYMRSKTGWYTYSKWVFPIISLRKYVPEIHDILYTKAIKLMKRYYWKEYEIFFGITLTKGESCSKDEFMFLEENKDKYIANYAVCEFYDIIPEGMVGVFASVGGKLDYDIKHIFLVNTDEYLSSIEYPFIINPSKHTKIDISMIESRNEIENKIHGIYDSILLYL